MKIGYAISPEQYRHCLYNELPFVFLATKDYGRTMFARVDEETHNALRVLGVIAERTPYDAKIMDLLDGGGRLDIDTLRVIEDLVRAEQFAEALCK